MGWPIPALNLPVSIFVFVIWNLPTKKRFKSDLCHNANYLVFICHFGVIDYHLQWKKYNNFGSYRRHTNFSLTMLILKCQKNKKKLFKQ